MKLKINEIFHSLQGEGARAGESSIFIRLAKCNLTCNFCDTEFESYKEMSIDDIKSFIKDFKSNWIVWTGGEPSLQLNSDIILSFGNYRQAIETNGSKKLEFGDLLNWVTVSPKVAEHVVAQNFKKVNELKYVIEKGKSLPVPKIEADHYFISPQSNGNLISKENLEYCISLIMENPKWKLTLQNHKIWSLR